MPANKMGPIVVIIWSEAAVPDINSCIAKRPPTQTNIATINAVHGIAHGSMAERLIPCAHPSRISSSASAMPSLTPPCAFC